jgi:peptide/nickel transport system substrate-binding protein
LSTSLDDSGRFSRREALGAAAVGLGGLAIAGCGSSGSTQSPSATTGTAPTPSVALQLPTKHGGIYRHGSSDSAAGDSLDPQLNEAANTNFMLNYSLYDTLTRPHFTAIDATNHLAEFLEPAKDLSYWDVRLHNAEFSNGKPVTADNVIFTLKRVLNPKSPGTDASGITSIDINRLKKLDTKTLRMYLKTPDRTLPLGFALPGTSILPLDYNPKKPYGSGPFLLQSFAPGRETVFVKNPNYWRSGWPFLDELHIVGFADPNATRMNALVAGQIDGADNVQPSLVPTIEGKPNVYVLVYKAYSTNTYEMRTDIPPFNDVRVRRAMKLIANRPQIVEEALSGARFGSVANDLFNPSDPVFDHSLPAVTQDIEQAKSLLKAAGQSDLHVTWYGGHFFPGAVETVEVLAQNATAAGMTIHIHVLPDTTTYFSKYAYQQPFKFDYWTSCPIITFIRLSVLPTASVNYSHFNNPKFNSLVAQYVGEPNFAKAKEHMAGAQQIFQPDSGQAIYAYKNGLDAYNPKFTGFAHTNVWGGGLNYFIYDSVGLA